MITAIITAIAEKPTSHKYDIAKGIIICSVFSVNAGYSPFNEIQNFVGLPELNFLFRELSQVGSMQSSFSCSLKDDGQGWSKGLRIHS